MYQSNQAKIKKEKPFLLPGRGQTPRGRLSLALTALAREQYPRYCSTTAAAAPLVPPLWIPTAHITP
jgi:hypothetical protein